MLNNFRNLRSLLRSHGPRWLLFRVGYALRKRAGVIRAQMPAYEWKDRPLQHWVKQNIPSNEEEYAQWRRNNLPKFFHTPFRPAWSDPALEGQTLEALPWNPQAAVEEAERILNGELKYFAHRFLRTGFPPDWHKDPVAGVGRDARKHWSENSDDGQGDIKFIWEASRFCLVYPLVRAYAATGDERYAEAFWTAIESWAESNPPNTGPNWMDGQEAALRLMTWTFGYHQFLHSPSSTAHRIARFTVLVAAHAERIHKNLAYAISTHSNHSISEAFGLWQTGLLFPELARSEHYLALGRTLLEQEAAAQIFPDGGYSMYSLNYHRFILHIYLCVIRLAELNQSPVSNLVLDRVAASIDYLKQLIDPQTGRMPVYGSNDGALVLPLNNCDFTDYRPLLQLGSYLTKKEFLFESGPWDEDILWLCGTDPFSTRELVRARQKSHASFPHAGVYILRDTHSKAILRCTDFEARPSHADQLHMDLWLGSENIACDAGTYLYSGEGVWRNALAHTSVHNTVTVDAQDQMKLLTRFTWTDWAKGRVHRHEEKLWQGEHDGYKRLVDPVSHRRTVLSLGDDRWLVVDHLHGKENHHYALHWMLADFPYERRGDAVILALRSTNYKVQTGVGEGTAVLSVVRGDGTSARGWRSRYYGDREPAISVKLETDQPGACFWTFFGFESDSVALASNVLRVSFQDRNVELDLTALDE